MLHMDESKNRFLLLRVGYRYLQSFSGDPDEHRAVLEATARYPLAAGVLVSSRARIDLRSIDSEDSWRFRSRLSAEKEFLIGPVRIDPYIRGEVSSTAGSMSGAGRSGSGERRFRSRRHVELEGYFNHQNDTGGDNNRQVDAIGIVLNLYL